MESWREQLRLKVNDSELSINEISDKTKIPSKFIEAIIKGEFRDLPAEIYAKSQIERLFKFFKIDPSIALEEYDEFISPPEKEDDGKKIENEVAIGKKLLNVLNSKFLKRFYLTVGGVSLFILFLSIFFLRPNGQDTESELVIINEELDSLVSEITEVNDQLYPKDRDKTTNSRNTEEKNKLSDNVVRKIEIIIQGESWVVVFDKNERILYELMQTGSYEFSGLSPLRFKIGYAPATDLLIDGEKINFSRAIKGATNYAHFWVNEGNEVESIRD